MPTYAVNTDVPADRSRGEIERTLGRYGATAFLYGWDGNRAVIGFQHEGRRYRISMILPDRNEFTRTDKGRARTSRAAIQEAYDQAVRQKWRALALKIKGDLEAAESGIVALEISLQPFILLPSGKTVGEWLSPQIDQVYLTGIMPPMLPGGKD